MEALVCLVWCLQVNHVVVITSGGSLYYATLVSVMPYSCCLPILLALILPIWVFSYNRIFEYDIAWCDSENVFSHDITN